jgi:YDR124W-like, helical bundle domain
MIISVPLPIWDMMPDHAAYSFIGYVTGPNLGCGRRPAGYAITQTGVECGREGDNMKDQLKALTAKAVALAKKALGGPFPPPTFSPEDGARKLDQFRVFPDMPDDSINQTSCSTEITFSPLHNSAVNPLSGHSDASAGKKLSPTGHTGELVNVDETEDIIPGSLLRRRQLAIGDENEVEAYYLTRFKQLQKNACIVMARTFVDFLEQEKQGHFYSKRGEPGPLWWPRPMHYDKGVDIEIIEDDKWRHPDDLSQHGNVPLKLFEP